MPEQCVNMARVILIIGYCVEVQVNFRPVYFLRLFLKCGNMGEMDAQVRRQRQMRIGDRL